MCVFLSLGSNICTSRGVGTCKECLSIHPSCTWCSQKVSVFTNLQYTLVKVKENITQKCLLTKLSSLHFYEKPYIHFIYYILVQDYLSDDNHTLKCIDSITDCYHSHHIMTELHPTWEGQEKTISKSKRMRSMFTEVGSV